MMNADKIIKLLDAGFSKDEIMKLAIADNDIPSPKPEPEKAAAEMAPAEAAAADPAPAEAEKKDPDISALIADTVKKELEAFKADFKMQVIPTMQDIKPLGIDDIIKNFFKED